MSRGLGELAIAAAWWLVVIGADYVQRGQFFLIPASLGFSVATLVACVLLINGVPDAAADARVGKRTLAVRLGARGAAALYLWLVLLAHGWLALSVWLLIPPLTALWGCCRCRCRWRRRCCSGATRASRSACGPPLR
ncbi:prenyltransferase [Ottowia beijingensis]|uniref:prenyltransferase n=1 Tax=Ottowia beijingensis TaxID=1207057 RepID=UPI00214D426F|nr:prenyltransferase [Ottowia beijingensis]